MWPTSRTLDFPHVAFDISITTTVLLVNLVWYLAVTTPSVILRPF